MGKTGLGDIKLSEDGTLLYAVNLSDQKLYRIPINNPNTFNSTANTAGITSFSITNGSAACRTGSVFRPFALKAYRGKLYVGGVCTNETVMGNNITYSATSPPASTTAPNLITRDTTGLKAVVYEFNPATSTFTGVPGLSLNYVKGADNNDKTGVDRADRWLPWTDVLPATGSTPNRFARADLPSASYPQPWLTGIEFDVDGSIILGIRDRSGDQFGNNNYGPNATTPLYRIVAPGDLLRASKCIPRATLWTLESNVSVCGGTATAGANNGQGPGNGEYHYSDVYSPFHNEIVQGGLAQLPGSGEVASVVLDPTDNIDSGGIRRFKNSDGSSSAATSLQVYVSNNVATYGKANGLGDLELSSNNPTIEIGNRVWFDTNKDGIQDAGETVYSAVSGLAIQLLQNGSVISVAPVTADGTYLFSSATIAAIQPNTAYQLRLVLPGNTTLGNDGHYRITNQHHSLFSDGNERQRLFGSDFGHHNGEPRRDRHRSQPDGL